MKFCKNNNFIIYYDNEDLESTNENNAIAINLENLFYVSIPTESVDDTLIDVYEVEFNFGKEESTNIVMDADEIEELIKLIKDNYNYHNVDDKLFINSKYSSLVKTNDMHDTIIILVVWSSSKNDSKFYLSVKPLGDN